MADRLLQCFLLNRLLQQPIVTNFHRKSFMFRSFFPCLLENSFSSLLTENILHSRGFYQKIIFKLNMVNSSM